MKFSSVCLFAVAAAAAAAVGEIRDAAAIAVRDFASINASLSTVKDDIATLNAVGNAFDGDIRPPVAASDKLAASIDAAVATARASTVLSLTDAFGLLPVLQGIRENTRALADTVKAKVSKMAQAGACAVARTHLERLNAGAGTLIDEVRGKLPVAARGVAKIETDKIRALIVEAVAAVAPERCRDGS
ncbi:Cell wall galactomannoprotein [Cordyceps fumosorosea ARSEF 2679]|uniref:Cell wall galactomannoprotein n=1 Tax=Cordyceps fumosorosea (strain ARSEF 2679) TaxID=1081104 RepID=A0A162J1A3_CORFA|nr:Cell wall galactomannoprotein [Cordyceps fumosorosea ARSEF 2679]OAA62332.1 Cell wall galactomannoprotein [Cordyceps fumosorosea ARSEF 2679]